MLAGPVKHVGIIRILRTPFETEQTAVGSRSADAYTVVSFCHSDSGYRRSVFFFEDSGAGVTIVIGKIPSADVVGLKVLMARFNRVILDGDDDEGALSMGLVYALDENDNNLGHIGYF